MFDFWIQFALVLTAILIGIRRGGVALGLIGGLGVAVLSFGFRVAPQEPPITVMLIILAVVTASATLQVAGGLDWLVQQAERVMRKHPQQITILAPLSTFLLTVCVGTGHAGLARAGVGRQQDQAMFGGVLLRPAFDGEGLFGAGQACQVQHSGHGALLRLGRQVHREFHRQADLGGRVLVEALFAAKAGVAAEQFQGGGHGGRSENDSF